MMMTHRYHLISVLFLLSLSPLSSAINSTLTQGQTIKDGDTMLSPGGRFELGFFSPGNSTSRYVGVLYHNVSTQSVVWVANRDAPLATSDGSIAIGRDGNLLVLDGEGGTVWSTNVSTATTNETRATIRDSGQLVVSSGDGTAIWDSFEHPTDSFLPGMKVSVNTKTGQRTVLTSWKSPNDPSVGKYSLGLDPNGSGQFFIWDEGRPRWRSGKFDGTKFIGATMRAMYLYGFKSVVDPARGSLYFTYTQYNSSLLRFVMQWDGAENTTMYDEEHGAWEQVWMQPVTACQAYGTCGDYGMCSDGGTPICSCLEGFEPRSSGEWGEGNWSGGCVRRAALACSLRNRTNSSGGDGFFRLQEVKVPDRSEFALTVVNEADCRSSCASNCSCEAYSYVTGIGCLTWGRDLVDILQFPEGEGGSDLYIKLASSELDTKSKAWRTIAIVISTALFLMAIICVLSWWKFNAAIKDWWRGNKTQLGSSMLISAKARLDLSGPSDFGKTSPDGNDVELPLFNFDFLADATRNFSYSNKLGEGGFGDVYKGLLPGGREVAVKRLSRSSGQGQEEFKNEMKLIAKLQHRNLVRLLGCCIQGEEKMLVYEYMPNKSLDAFLFDPKKQALLDWTKRFDIIEGVARGLVYLHRDSRLRIVHRDLKASNILLDDDMKPKISDFGMARIFGNDQNQDSTTRVVGTIGYMSPEYAMEGLFSVKSDVYSFGILVLELVSGRRNSSFHHIPDIMNIVRYTWRLWSEDRMNEMIDPTIQESCSVAQVFRCVHVALLCVQDRADDRPDMQSILLMLGSEAATPPTPRPPTFALQRSPNRTDSIMENIIESYSVDDMSITVIVGR
ncbi:putative G-type lectin S-receptor-like serine/threonine-protein kinase B120 [Iris pallida]|uniref:Receptor-like serine/threonine-protein kinase n=1 Tax=Iris pallida TaxID=29817 RepID=A0AAX6GGF9_IRIPA|nr:putative G-type lectin S-receptor-like serine/threonine-protein kinase B120 [Iris pallida]